MTLALLKLPRTVAICWLLLAPVLVSPVVASLPPANPAVVQFESDISAYPQNFVIAADHAGYVYLGNVEGVQVFDGESWQLLPLPNKEVVRSLAFDGDSRVYVGGFEEFGYLERGSDGAFAYVSLVSSLADTLNAEDFGSIWGIQVSSAGVFFVADTHLFRFDPRAETTTHWIHEAGFGAIGAWRDKVYLLWFDEGLRAYTGDRWQTQTHADFGDEYLHALLPLPDSLLVIAESAWYHFEESAFTEIEGARSTIVTTSGALCNS